jgi:hypothetical protein
MSAFDDFRAAVIDEAEALAKTILKRGVKEARADAAAFVDNSAEKLERWTRLVAAGELTADEFASLVRSQKDLAELSALTKAGIQASRLQKFREKLVDAAVDTAFNVLL